MLKIAICNWLLHEVIFIVIALHNKSFIYFPGLLPWNTVPGKACGMTLFNVCKTREVSVSCRPNMILFLIANPQRIGLSGLPEIDLTSNVSAYSSDLVNLILQFFLTYDLYIAAFAGAGITLLALVSNKTTTGD